ncbi:MAG: NADH-quinone oxidoreductase subunit N [Planctomycetes bacterium]|nr:NADH-quinone oxidoreductase subunit N [Planctomycetota bacterium]
MNITWVDWISISPALAVIGAAFLVVLVDMLLPKDASKAPLEIVSYTGIGAALYICFRRLGEGMPPVRGFFGSVVLDELSVYLSLAILAATALLVTMSGEDMRRRKVHAGEFYAIVLLAAAGMILLVQSVNLIMIFLMIEILSLCVYVLTGITRRQPRSGEAAMKYFVTGAFASGFLLYGMAFLYGATGSVQLAEIAVRLREATPMALLGMGLLLVGFAFKVGAVPFHMWVPDVYEGAPTPVTAFMSVAVKAAAFGALVRVCVAGLPAQSAQWGGMVWGLAAATMIVGNLMAVPQRSVKRMLAYSSIAHAGYVLLGLAALKTSHAAAGAAIFYLFVYTFMTFGAFATLAYLGREVSFPGARAPEWHDAEDLFDFAGVARRKPWTAAAMTLFLLSLAGIPPTAGFAGKFMLFRAAIQEGHYVLALIGILMSIVSVYYYLRVVVYMYMKDPLEEPSQKGDMAVGAAVATAAFLTILLGLMPGTMHELSLRAMEHVGR